MDPSGHKFVEDNDANPCRIVGGCETITNKGYVEHPRILRQKAENKTKPVRKWAKKFVANMMRPYPLNVLSQAGLPLPDQTVSVDVGYLLGGGGAVRGSLSLAADANGDIAILANGGAGGASPIESVGLSLTVTNAASVDDLAGPSVQLGGQLGEVAALTSEVTMFADRNGKPRFGISVGGAATLPDGVPVAIYGTAEYTKILMKFSTSDIIDFWFDKGLEVMYGKY